MPASLHGNGAIRAIFFAALLCALAAALALSGCVHRIEIRQGDARVAQNAEKLATGMSQSEVQDLLGEPQTRSPFRSGHWIYLYKKREDGFFGDEGRFVVKVSFADKRVRDIQILEEGSLPEFEPPEEKVDAKDAEAEADAKAEENAEADAEADAENAEADAEADTEVDAEEEEETEEDTGSEDSEVDKGEEI